MTATSMSQDVLLTGDEVRELLRAKCKKYGMKKEWARKCGISATFLFNVLKRGQEPTRPIYDALGLERVILYRPKTHPESQQGSWE